MRRKRSERDPRRSVVARRGVTRSRKKIGCMMNARTDASTDRSSRRPARVTRHCTYASLCWHRSPRRRPVPRAIHLAAAAAERGGRLVEKRASGRKISSASRARRDTVARRVLANRRDCAARTTRGHRRPTGARARIERAARFELPGGPPRSIVDGEARARASSGLRESRGRGRFERSALSLSREYKSKKKTTRRRWPSPRGCASRACADDMIAARSAKSAAQDRNHDPLAARARLASQALALRSRWSWRGDVARAAEAERGDVGRHTAARPARRARVPTTRLRRARRGRRRTIGTTTRSRLALTWRRRHRLSGRDGAGAVT